MNLKVLVEKDEESENNKYNDLASHFISLSHNNVSLGVTTIETNAIDSIR
jgi:hypothetical protein